MSKGTIAFIGFLIGYTISAIILVAIIETSVRPKEYKQGFIDAKTGVETYKLETQPDSSRIWVKQD